MKQPSTHWLNKTHAGDCLGLLQRMRDDGVRVQTCITSPPYFRLRNYLPLNHPDKSLEIGACETLEQYIARLVQVFRAVREILSDDGTLWIVIGDSYAGSRPVPISAASMAQRRQQRTGLSRPAMSRPKICLASRGNSHSPCAAMAGRCVRTSSGTNPIPCPKASQTAVRGHTNTCSCCPNARAITLTRAPCKNPQHGRAGRVICTPRANRRMSICGYATTCTKSAFDLSATSAMYGRSPPAGSRAVTLPSFHRS